MTERPAALPALTSLRFFAAAAIVAFHIMPMHGIPRNLALANGVSFFFVLSGFILTYNYRDLSGRLRQFYIARFARLWPVHVLTLCLAVLLIPFKGGPFDLVLNLLLVHAWVPVRETVFSFNGVSWSVSAEVFFYLAFPLLLAVRSIWLWYVGIVLWTGLAVSVANYFSNDNALVFVLQNPTVRFLEFATGVVAARLFVRRPPNWGFKTGTILEIGAVAVVVVFAISRGVLVGDLKGHGLRMWMTWISQSAGFLPFAEFDPLHATSRPAGRNQLRHIHGSHDPADSDRLERVSIVWDVALTNRVHRGRLRRIMADLAICRSPRPEIHHHDITFNWIVCACQYS
jgi:peptidoglycan/LPS O-acetylase OafA/YrhL